MKYPLSVLRIGRTTAAAALAALTLGCSAWRGHVRSDEKPAEPKVANATGSVDPGLLKTAGPADESAPVPPSIPVAGEPYVIDLTTSLRLADNQNPELGEARVGIMQALAVRSQARALLLPSLNAGMNYHGHDGNLQRSSGRILKLSEQSFYIGGGARTLAAETVGIPAVNIATPLADAFYEPKAAERRLDAARFNASAAGNRILLEVARLFLDLVAAEATLESWQEAATEARGIARRVQAYADTGQGRKADADRAGTEVRLFEGEVLKAEEEVAVASARLSRQLNLDASVRLHALTGPLEPIEIIDPERPLEELTRTAIQSRPDIAARAAGVAEAEVRRNEEKARPLLPTLWVGFSGGAFGGGSNITPPLMSHFGGRTDLDVRATWTLLNFGAGNASLIKRRGAEVGIADSERARTVNLARAEVGSARAEAIAQRRNVEVARAELASARDGFREDSIRLREEVGLPIEVLDSLKLLAHARVNLIKAVTKSNQAQFALFTALGSPPPLVPIGSEPVGPPPITTPLLSPIRAE